MELKKRPPKWRNTIYERRCSSKTVKIHYFLHPLYQQEVPVVDQRNFVHETYYLIALFDKTCFMPIWMSDPAYCRDLQLKEHAHSSLKALTALRLLIDRI